MIWKLLRGVFQRFWVMYKSVRWVWGPRIKFQYKRAWVTSLNSSRFTSVPHGAWKLWFTVVLLHLSKVSDPMNNVLLWSRPDRIVTLVTPYLFFVHLKKRGGGFDLGIMNFVKWRSLALILYFLRENKIRNKNHFYLINSMNKKNSLYSTDDEFEFKLWCGKATHPRMPDMSTGLY